MNERSNDEWHIVRQLEWMRFRENNKRKITKQKEEKTEKIVRIRFHPGMKNKMRILVTIYCELAPFSLVARLVI